LRWHFQIMLCAAFLYPRIKFQILIKLEAWQGSSRVLDAIN
jgi:hypothetical protein